MRLEEKDGGAYHNHLVAPGWGTQSLPRGLRRLWRIIVDVHPIRLVASGCSKLERLQPEVAEQ